MAFSRIYIFVEGNDDERFFYSIIAPLFKKYYTDVEVFKYAQWKKVKVYKFLESIKTLDYDYIFTCDIDQCENINEKQKIVKSKFRNLEMQKIEVVIAEIESWYYAGMEQSFIEKYSLADPPNTNQLTKEDFNRTYAKKFRSRYDFMAEIVEHFSIENAKKKNLSFREFIEKYKL
jgi:hypothetical protein